VQLLIAAAIFLAATSLAWPAHAYLDAGVGSMIVQLLLGGTAGLLVVGKLYWTRIKRVFVRRSADKPTDIAEAS
jgi:hypothetical protein